MSRRALRPASLAICVALGALGGCAPEREHRAQVYALSTLVEVSVMRRDVATAHADVAAVEQELRRVERVFRAWDDGGLAEANRALARDGHASVAPELAAALADAQALSAASDGRFDPGVGRLVELWGFNTVERAAGPPPPAARLRDALSTAPRIARVAIGRTTLDAAPAAPWLDLGGYAKGLAVDRAIATLRARGVRDALVDAGGDLRAIGAHAGRPWRIGIRDPRAPRVLMRLEVAGDACVFTSGDDERAFDWDGVHYHHIIDPATGAPARGAASVTVLREQSACAPADAAAITLMVAGPGSIDEVVQRFGLSGTVVITEDGTVHASAALARRLTPLVEGLHLVGASP